MIIRTFVGCMVGLHNSKLVCGVAAMPELSRAAADAPERRVDIADLERDVVDTDGVGFREIAHR
jgi:hypothetical protein